MCVFTGAVRVWNNVKYLADESPLITLRSLTLMNLYGAENYTLACAGFTHGLAWPLRNFSAPLWFFVESRWGQEGRPCVCDCVCVTVCV